MYHERAQCTGKVAVGEVMARGMEYWPEKGPQGLGLSVGRGRKPGAPPPPPPNVYSRPCYSGSSPRSDCMGQLNPALCYGENALIEAPKRSFCLLL